MEGDSNLEAWLVVTGLAVRTPRGQWGCRLGGLCGEGLEVRLDLLVTGYQLTLIGIEELEVLFQYEDVLRPIVSCVRAAAISATEALQR